MKRFCFLISRATEPWIVLLFTIFVITNKLVLPSADLKIVITSLIIFNIVLPLIAFIYLKEKGKISDIDISKRGERITILVVTFLSMIVPLFIFSYFSIWQFFYLQIVCLTIVFSLFVITKFYKISAHTMASSAAIFLINYYFQFKYLWLFLIVVIIAFCRVYLKKHTFGQVIFGSIIGATIPAIFLIK